LTGWDSTKNGGAYTIFLTGAQFATPLTSLPPVITSSAASDPQVVAIGQTVNFTVAATDPGGNALTYTWDFGDSSAQGYGASTGHVYTAPGVYNAQVTVSDGVESVTSATQVSVGQKSEAAWLSGEIIFSTVQATGNLRLKARLAAR
jgi:PKD repeat protein